METLREKTTAFSAWAVAIKTNQGAAVDQMLQQDYTVYPINPAAAASYRHRKAPNCNKTDQVDAWSLGERSSPTVRLGMGGHLGATQHVSDFLRFSPATFPSRNSSVQNSTPTDAATRG